MPREIGEVLAGHERRIEKLEDRGRGLKSDGSVKTTSIGAHRHDGSEVRYTPDDAGDWDAGDPGNVDDGLDELAQRVADIEGGAGAGSHTVLSAAHTDSDAADTPADGDVLTYDFAAALWKAVAPTGGVSDAADVTYTPAVLTDWNGDADPGDVDQALDQLAERIDDAEIVAAAHLADATDAHDASAISIVDAAGDFTADNVEDALAELQADNEAHVAAADPHAGYVREADADWIDLTDSGATTLHSHAAALTVQRNDVTVDAAAATLDFSGEFEVTSSPATEANVSLSKAAQWFWAKT